MSKVKAGPINADRLKSFIERIERLETERAAIGSDIRDVYAEAKGVGYDVKTMRKIVQLRKMDAADRDEQETLLDVYLHALGMAMEPAARAVMGGMSYGLAAEKFGVPKTSLYRVVPRTGVDAECGTITETADCGGPPAASAGTTDRPDGPGSARGNQSCGRLVEADRAGVVADTGARPVSSAGVASGPQDPIQDAAGRSPGEEGGSVLSDRDAPSDEHSAPRLQGRMANAGDGGETAATRCRPSPSTPDEIDLTPPAELVAKRREIESRRPKVPA
jgi:uncharacterized protein (UPF0335 family)